MGKSFDKIMAFLRTFETMDINVDKFISFIMKNRISSRKIQQMETEFRATNPR